MPRHRLASICSSLYKLIALVAMGFLVSACGSLRYYGQAVRGQTALLVHRQPVVKLLRDNAVAPELAARLRQAQEARRFAVRQLGLPDNRSYTTYVDLGRPYVVWNVFVAPRHSVNAVPQCFPIAGCVAYRGWFKEADAQADAARWRARGDDVWLGGVPAYSTLGWFNDPILSSMLERGDDALDGTIFHELAHQLIYLKGDTAFSESFASFVERQGLREWRAHRQLPATVDDRQAMARSFTRLVLDLRGRLGRVYASDLAPAAMDAAKAAEIDAFRQRYALWRANQWAGDTRYDAWVNAPINNARLLPFGLYDHWEPAFAELFRREGHQWAAFYDAVRALAKLPQAQREAALQALLPDKTEVTRGA